ncbi:permease prefix domain 1-containing protein [Streptomyces sp. ADMS]|uniref:permease prefix domain 1-containing protein n=1 Tax=Streptomyces sp. ADMS TaxID=3071415 RepID=UPI00296EE77B|nr:permease prefix domain 1-containing protein [Streptomyces sp. ADMS]MDW4905893.1 permease prefix domain 1-containing protein [Streptomyces sp. ADMS]
MIDRYVEELAEALHGPRAAKADLLTEARDGLFDAAEAYEESGLDRESAERLAVADFGAVQTIAPDYQAELGLAEGRRTAVLICAVLIAQPVAWWAMLRLAGHGGGGDVSAGYLLVDQAVRWTGGIAIAIALSLAIATGAGVRFLGIRRRLVRAAGLFAFLVCAVFGVLGLLLTLYSPATDSLLGITGLPGTALLLGIPLAAVAVAGHRCLRAA